MRAELDPALHESLANSIAKGTLIAAGDCVSSRTVKIGPGAARKVGEVQSVANITVSNLSARWVWAVEVSISGPELQRDQAVWRANLPFLPPHSEVEVEIGCAHIPSSEDGAAPSALNNVHTSGHAETLDTKLAALLASEAPRYRSAGPGRVRAWKPEPASSLAATALPHLDDPELARTLLRALLAQRDASLTDAQLFAWFEQAERGAALVLAEHLMASSPDGAARLLERGLARGRVELEPALQLARDSLWARASEEQRLALYREQLTQTLAPALDANWKRTLFERCALTDEAFAALITALVQERRAALPGAPATSPALAALLEHAPEADLERLRLVLSSPATELPGVLARLGESPAATARSARLESMLDDAAQRAATLEQLTYYSASPTRLARFDRIAAALARADAPALEPMFVAALARPELSLAWLARLFELAQLERARLHPLALDALAGRQAVFTAQALATAQRPAQELAELFTLDPCFAALTLDNLAHCVALFESDPLLDELARTPEALTPAFVHGAVELLSEAEATPELQTLALALARHGIALDAVVDASCARAEQLAAAGEDPRAELEFGRALAPDRACVRAQDDRRHRERLARQLLLGAAVLVLVLLALAWRRRKRD